MYETADSKFHPVSLSTTSGYISDINTIAPTLNQVLKWDGTKYTPATISGGSSTLASLTDCDINSTTPLQNSQILQYNSTLNKWINTSSANQNLYYYQSCAGPSTDYYSASTTAITVGAQTIQVFPFFSALANRQKITNSTTAIFDDTINSYMIKINAIGVY